MEHARKEPKADVIAMVLQRCIRSCQRTVKFAMPGELDRFTGKRRN